MCVLTTRHVTLSVSVGVSVFVSVLFDLLHTLSPMLTPLLDDVGRSVGTGALRLRTYRCTSKWVSLGILFSRDCPPCEFDLRQVFYVPVCMCV